MTFIDPATEILPHHITTPARLARVAVAPAPLLDVTIPVHNEERDLEVRLRRLHAHLTDSFPHSSPGSPSRTTRAPTAPCGQRDGSRGSCTKSPQST